MKEFTATPGPNSDRKSRSILESPNKTRPATALSSRPSLLVDEPEGVAKPAANVAQFYTKPKRPLNSKETKKILITPPAL